MTTPHLGVVIDPFPTLSTEKDTTLAMMSEALSRGWQVSCTQVDELRIKNGKAEGFLHPLVQRRNGTLGLLAGNGRATRLGTLDMVLMRKDPPVDLEYLAATHVLERAETEGALVVNRPRALRDANEKISTTWFPQCCPANVITRSMADLKEFLKEQGRIVLKPLNAMGGRSVFVVAAGDENTNVILEEMTCHGSRFIQAQAYIPEIAQTGDKRILLIDGEPVPYALARMKPVGEARANMAVGGRPEGRALTERDRWICREVGPVLRDMGLWFVGLDVIGDYLTEINVTSPTGVRQLDKMFGLNISATFLDFLENQLNPSTRKDTHHGPRPIPARKHRAAHPTVPLPTIHRSAGGELRRS